MEAWVLPDERSRCGRRSRAGLDTQTLVSSWREMISQKTGASKKAGPLGGRHVSRKTIAQGRPDDPVEPLVTAVCSLFCRRAADTTGARPSLRPSFIEGGRYQQLGRIPVARAANFWAMAGIANRHLRPIESTRRHIALRLRHTMANNQSRSSSAQ
jgi:hypothetical protein